MSEKLRIPEKLYHVSCIQNHHSITQEGLVPFKFTTYNEYPGPVYLAKKKPSSRIDMMRDPDDKSNPILDSYMQLSSYKHEECPVFNLYEIDTSFLIPNKFEKTSDKRELTYSDIIPPETITLIRQYNTKEIENRFIENEEAKLPWHA